MDDTLHIVMCYQPHSLLCPVGNID